jgi:predicted dehydrogenase
VSHHRIALVGVGRIGRTHVRALEFMPDVDVVAAVDVDPGTPLRFRGEDVAVHRSVGSLAAAAVDIVVVATPTSTHHEVFGEVRDLLPGVRVLVEKPAAASRDQFDAMFGPGEDRGRLPDVIYHAAHAPEVLWARARMAEWRARWGPVRRHEMYFSDPYGDLDEAVRSATYGTSWFDSGINALSVCAGLSDGLAVQSVVEVDRRRSVYRARLAVGSGRTAGSGEITTSWDVDAPAKHSVLTFDVGARLVLDHQRVVGRVEHGDGVVEEFRHDGWVPRLVAHYVNAFADLLADRPSFFGPADHRHLHHQLFHPTQPAAPESN